MRRVPGELFNLSIDHMDIVDNAAKSQSTIEKKWHYAPFPANVEQIRPTEYYVQFKEQYAVYCKSISAHTSSYKAFIVDFKFSFDYGTN